VSEARTEEAEAHNPEEENLEEEDHNQAAEVRIPEGADSLAAGSAVRNLVDLQTPAGVAEVAEQIPAAEVQAQLRARRKMCKTSSPRSKQPRICCSSYKNSPFISGQNPSIAITIPATDFRILPFY
jgi:hypothetical protein